MGLNSIESEIAIKKLLFLGRLIKEPKTSLAMKSLFESRTKSFFDSDITSLGVLQRHYINMSCLITLKIGMIALHSQIRLDGKKLCGIRSSILKGMHGIASVNLILK